MSEKVPTYEEAQSLLNEFVKSDSLLKHSYAVEGVMRYMARKMGEDENKWAVIGLIHDLDYGIKLVPVPLVRDDDGLAVSSRNTRLSKKERKTALKISKTLAEVAVRVRELEETGEEDEISVSDILAEFAEDLVSDPAIELDYFAAVDIDTLSDVIEVRKGTVFAIAAYVGETRLIDNWIYR